MRTCLFLATIVVGVRGGGGEWYEAAFALFRLERSGETFEEGSGTIGAMVLATIVRDPRERRRITRYSLTTPYTLTEDTTLS